jgi:hypothetical protein
VRIQAKTGYYAWPDPPGAQARQAIDAAISTAFDATEIGLRGTLSPGPKDGRAVQFDVLIDAKDVALGREGDQYSAHLRLAFASYLAGGRIEGSAVIHLDLHYSTQERDQALKERIRFFDNVVIGGR